MTPQDQDLERLRALVQLKFESWALMCQLEAQLGIDSSLLPDYVSRLALSVDSPECLTNETLLKALLELCSHD